MVVVLNVLPVRGKFWRERLAIGRMHEVKKSGTDFVLKKCECSWCLNAVSLL